ncbi:MAG: NUDIX domain-containing protein [Oscillospiraceae bacterium]|jgi:8-oxo-dGTP pyrophosphatase MutT (NUDIX family)|nr:NUDIX domain-containing protein [Oscillospiraceae bacterium]
MTNQEILDSEGVQPEEKEPSLGYIMNLRKYVGHSPLIMCGAGVIAENTQGEILLGRRRDNGMWDDAGGALELGESLEDCAKRELLEEMGITANRLEVLGVFSGAPPFTYPNGDVVENVSVVYVCRDFCGTPKAQTEEVSELRWFSLAELINDFSLINPPSRVFFEKYIESRSH